MTDPCSKTVLVRDENDPSQDPVLREKKLFVQMRISVTLPYNPHWLLCVTEPETYLIMQAFIDAVKMSKSEKKYIYKRNTVDLISFLSKTVNARL